MSDIVVRVGENFFKMASIATGVSEKDIRSKVRKPEAVNARGMVMWAYHASGFSKQEICERFGISERAVRDAIKNLKEREKFQSKLNQDFTAFKAGLKMPD